MDKNPSSRKIKESNNPSCSTTRPEILMSRLKSLRPLRSLPRLLTSKSHNQPSFHRSFSLSHLSSSSSSSPLPSASAVRFISTCRPREEPNIHYNIPPFLDEIPPPAKWGIVMVPENQAYVVERMGGWSLKTLYSGIHFLIPVVDRITHVHSLKEEVFLLSDTIEITKDDAHILIDSVTHVKIVDPLLASYQLLNPILVVASMSSVIMLENVRKMNLNEIFEEMDTLNENIMKSTNEVGTRLGVKCLRYAIRDISPSPKVGAVIEMQAKAERRKLAQVLESEGEAKAIRKKARATEKFMSLLSDSIKVSGGVKGMAQLLPSTVANPASMMAQAPPIYKRPVGNGRSTTEPQKISQSGLLHRSKVDGPPRQAEDESPATDATVAPAPVVFPVELVFSLQSPKNLR
ncbi:uncharacterized protein LOC131229424 isoform X1 [Magnolia sinica]|uniref:uncharacterized protein LOC131229424 isoform X1 n=1 Tax=Magnolia sinica TaxID=86752 RepID=UPI00265A8327|nr:uncharacterized protein LOC131229424 isoform X1 [Magnolia sinica]